MTFTVCIVNHTLLGISHQEAWIDRACSMHEATIEKPEGKRPVRRERRIWKDYVKMKLRE
jgi:hypothetical protein